MCFTALIRTDTTIGSGAQLPALSVAGGGSSRPPGADHWCDGMKCLVPSMEALTGQPQGVNDDMRKYCGQVGVISGLTVRGDGGRSANVKFPDGKQWHYEASRLLLPGNVLCSYSFTLCSEDEL